MNDPQVENDRLKKQLTDLSLGITQQEQTLSDTELMLKFLKTEELAISQAMVELDVKDKAYLNSIYQLTERIRHDVIVADEYFLTGKLPK